MADDDDQDPTFTQDDVTSAATRAAKEAERKARQKVQQDIADQLGCTIDEAKAILDKQRQADDANATEVERARKAEADAKAEAAAAVARANKVAATSTATTALLAAKLNPENLADALKLIDVDPDDDAEAAKEKAEALAKRLPALFTPADGTPPPPTGVTPPRPPARPGGDTKTAAERARERFDRTHPKSAA